MDGMDDVMLTPQAHQLAPVGQMGSLVIPQPTRTPDMLSNLGSLGDPIWDFFEQRIFGVPVWVIGLGLGGYFLYRTTMGKKSGPRKAWEEA